MALTSDGVDLDADRLPDQIDRQDQPRVRSLPHQASDDALSGPCVTSTIMPSRISGQGSNWRSLSTSRRMPRSPARESARFAVERDDVDDAGALQDRQPLCAVEPREAVAGKQRPVDLLLAVFPAAPARDRRQEGFEPFRSSCSRTTCSCRERVQMAYHAGASVHVSGSSTAAAPLRLGRASAFVDLLQLLVLPLDDRLRAQRVRNFRISTCVRASATLSAIRSRTSSNGCTSASLQRLRA